MRARRNLIGCGIVLAATSTALRAAQNVPSGLSLPEITATLVGCEKAYAQLLLQKEDQKLCESLDRALTLGSDCRWNDCAKQVRVLLGQHAERARHNARFLASLLFALEYAATVTKEDVQKIFSTEDAAFDPGRGTLALGYHDAVPAAWELQGTRAQGSGTLVLSGGKTVSVQVPFRRPGGPRYHGSTQAVEAPSLGLGRMAAMKNGSTVELGWATHDETGKNVRVVYVLERLESGTAQVVTELRIEDKTKLRRPPVRVGKAAFVTLGDLAAQVEKRDVVFSLGGTYRQRAVIPGAGCLRFAMKGDGAAVQFDWIKVSGAVDGLWLSRQLVLRMKTRAEPFLKNWDDPFR